MNSPIHSVVNIIERKNFYSRVVGKISQKLHISDRKSKSFIGIGYTPIVVEQDELFKFSYNSSVKWILKYYLQFNPQDPEGQ